MSKGLAARTKKELIAIAKMYENKLNQTIDLVDAIYEQTEAAADDNKKCHTVGFDGLQYIIKISEIIEEYRDGYKRGVS